MTALKTLPVEQTVSAFANAWLRRLRLTKRVKPGTLRTYRSAIENHITPRWGPYRLLDVRPADVRAWIVEMAQVLSPQTVRNIYSVFRNLMAEAEVDELVPRSPCRLRPTDLPRVQRRAGDVLSPEDLLRAIDQDDAFWASLLLFLLRTGCRVGEALALRWSDLDLEDDIPHAVLDRSSDDRSGVIGSTKTSATKAVPLVTDLENAMWGWFGAYEGETGEAPAGDRLVWPARRGRDTGKPTRSSVVWEHLQTSLRRAGVAATRTHAIRKTFVTQAANAEGVNVEVVRRITHPSPKTAFDGYNETPLNAKARELAKVWS